MNIKINLFLVVVVVVYNAVYCLPEEKYSTKYDNIDIGQILKSDRLLMNYINCLLERGTCTNDAKDLKNVLTDAIETDCSKCSETQKEKSNEVIHHIIVQKPDIWKELEDKFDPDGNYRLKYEAEMEEIKKGSEQ